MQLEQKKLLLDILTSIESIELYLGKNRNFQVYLKKKIIQRAVERELEIIGEATNRILKLDPNFPISDARRIVNLRNRAYRGRHPLVLISAMRDSMWPLKNNCRHMKLGDSFLRFS